MNTYKVYAKTNENSDIIDVNSSAFLLDTTGWTQIDEGTSDRYHHAQGHYFSKPIMTDSGVYRYRFVDGQIVEKTEQEIADEIAALPPPSPSQETALMSMAIDHEYRLILLEMGV